MHTLHGAHSKVFIMIVNNETILRKAEVLCKDQFFSLPTIHQQEIARNWTKANDFPKSLWNEIREPVKEALSDAFKGLVKEDKLQTLIDVKVNKCIQRQLEHAIPYMNPPLAVEMMARQAEEAATSSNDYLPHLNSRKDKRKKDESKPKSDTSKKSKTFTPL